MASSVQNVRLRRQDAQHRQTRRRLLTTAPDRALPTAVSSERMPTRAATEMTAQRAHLSPRAIASDGSHVTMPAAAAPVPRRSHPRTLEGKHLVCVLGEHQRDKVFSPGTSPRKQGARAGGRGTPGQIVRTARHRCMQACGRRAFTRAPCAGFSENPRRARPSSQAIAAARGP